MKFLSILFEAIANYSHKFVVPLYVAIRPPLRSGRISTTIGASLKTAQPRNHFFNYATLKLLLLLFFCSAALSQTSIAQTNLIDHYEGDIVFFRNGGVVYGKILNVENDTIQFELITKKVISFKTKLVKKIIQKFDQEGTKILQSFLRKPYHFKENGIYNYTYFNLPQGFDQRNTWSSGLGLHHITGKQFNRWLGAGVGVGFDGYDINNGRNVLSLYADVRGYTKAQNFSPYYSLGVGYGFGIRNNEVGVIKTKGGLFLNPSVGYRFGGSANANFVMGLGYKLQIATFEWNSWNAINRQRYVFRRLNLSLGVLF